MHENDETRHQMAPFTQAPAEDEFPTTQTSATPQPTAAHPPSGSSAEAPQITQPAPNVQNIYITQQVQQAPAVAMMTSPKSVVVALVLTFFFGPLGMFYSTVTGGVVMLLVSIVAIPLTLGIAALITWPICMVWAAIAASNSRTNVQTMTQIAR